MYRGFKETLTYYYTGDGNRQKWRPSNFSYGVMGGQYQPVGQVHVLNSILDFNLSPQQAISFPRAFHFNNIYKLERTVSKDVMQGLKEIGHNVEYIDETHGGGQAISIDQKKW